jgi:hypothetical protein
LTHRRSISVASGVMLFLIVALAGILLVPSSNAQALQCSASCKAAYGSCYKSTQDRNRCQAQLQRCLESCIRSKR